MMVSEWVLVIGLVLLHALITAFPPITANQVERRNAAVGFAAFMLIIGGLATAITRIIQ